MVPRAVSPAMSDGDDFDRSYPESSPDPLAGSINANTTRPKPRQKPARTSKAPLGSSSPSKQNRRPSFAEQVLDEFSSPSKSMVMSTGRKGAASPWRIKVTVEAEPGSDSNMESPTVKHLTRTKTTTVPLKDPDASSPVKRIGRPRKSEASSGAKKKRSGTPVRRKSASRARDSSVGAGDADADTTDNAPKKRGRPRKSVQLTARDNVTSEDMGQEAAITNAPYEASEHAVPETEAVHIAPKKRRGRPRKSQLANEETGIMDVIEGLMDMTPAAPVEREARASESQINAATPEPVPQVVVPFIQTTFATPQDVQQKPSPNLPLNSKSLLPPKEMAKRQKLVEYDAPTIFTPPETDLSRRIHARKATPTTKGILVSDDSSGDDSDVHTPSGTDEEIESIEPFLEEPQVLPGMVRPEEPEPIVAEAIDDDQEDYMELQDVTDFALDEGATRMPDDTTILDCEDFSMVSVDSLPSSGGLSSPPSENVSKPTEVGQIDTRLDQSYLQIPSVTARNTRSSPRQQTISPSTTSNVKSISCDIRSSPPAPPKRQHTPSIDSRCPSNPPSIVPAHFSPSQIDTPRIGKVVKAGVALQGVLDPNRLTPTTSSPRRTLDKQRDTLDDLFRGFSEGTRKELHAGLRLGEQLAESKRAAGESSPALSSPCKVTIPTKSSDDVFCPRAISSTSRLLTPEDQADYTLPLPPVPAEDTEVHYPTLMAPDQGSHLVSPARSEDEMSWKVDTPPVRAIPAEVRGSTQVYLVADEIEHEHHSDMWQDEAIRPSVSGETSQLQDLFANDGPVKPARGKLPNTWRQKSSNHFNYSDEAEPEPEHLDTPSSSESDESILTKQDKGKEKAVEPHVIEEQYHDDEDEGFSEASDDTGMFFQSNLPNVFSRKTRLERRAQKNEELGMSLLEGESLLPESSPSASVMKTPPKSNPFKNTPPRFAALQASPVKSSPLRNEVRASDSEESYQRNVEESSILPPSSPFRTMVDEASLATGSDERQLRTEMEGHTDSSIRHVRNEADEYLYAYEPQERTLGDIEEVTERSRSYQSAIHQSTIVQSTMLPSSPPQAIETSILAPRRTYAPLFGDAQNTTASSSNARAPSVAARSNRSVRQDSTPVIARAPSIEEPAQTQSGLFTRLTTSLWGALGPSSPPPLHPVTSKFDPLPKVEPWTRTHFKTLDALFQLHKKQPTLFAPSSSSSTSNTNNALLAWFIAQYEKKDQKFLGAMFSNWGYEVVLTEPLVVLCAVYMQLLTCKDIVDYEAKSGKKIQIGECGPSEAGTPIDGYDVVKRLVVTIMGEQLRRDERRGVEIKRDEGGLKVVWGV